MPSNEQLALFVRRLKRTMRDEKGRSFLGVAIGEGDFALYPDVIRVVEWMEHLIGANASDQLEIAPKPTLRKAFKAIPEPTVTDSHHKDSSSPAVDHLSRANLAPNK